MRWVLIAGALLLAIALGLAGGWFLHVHRQARDIRGSATKEFVPTELPPPEPKEPGVAWPTYGYDPERLRFPNGISLAPPFKRVWTFRAQSLVEFPPAVAYGRLYFANNEGVVFAVSAKTGKRAWKFASGRCQAMSPTVDAHTVYVTFLNKPPCNASGRNLDGEVVALWAGSGTVRWRRRIGPSESSPLVRGGNVSPGLPILPRLSMFRCSRPRQEHR